MQNVSDIKFTHKQVPELSVISPGIVPDTGSAAGFFSILKSQISPQLEIGVIQTEKPDLSKNAVQSAETQRSSQESRAYEKEEGKALAHSIDQAKAGIKENKKESNKQETATATGGLGEKKPAPEAHLGHKNAIDINNEKLVKKPKLDKSDTETLNSLLESLNRMMEPVRKPQEGPTATHTRSAIAELRDFIVGAQSHPMKNQIKKALEKAASYLEKIYAQIPASETKEHMGMLLTAIRDALTKLKQPHDRNQNLKQAQPASHQTEGINDAFLKQHPVYEGAKAEGLGQRQGNEGGNLGSLFGSDQAKNDSSVKRPGAPQAVMSKGSIFNDGLETMIQNARVAVRDAKNASFSIRLHPKELGSVNINLGLLDGVVHGKFLVDSPEAKAMLQSELAHIMDEMRQAGISVGEFQVDVSGQRERLLQDTSNAQGALVAPASGDETMNQYASNSMLYHDGYVNVLI